MENEARIKNSVNGTLKQNKFATNMHQNKKTVQNSPYALNTFSQEFNFADEEFAQFSWESKWKAEKLSFAKFS